MTTLKNGDIYFWRYKDTSNYNSDPYWCRSQKAIVRDGKLYDTYWHSFSDRKVINPDEAELTYKGNIDELEEISSWDAKYYDSSVLVDMRHSNSSSERVYVKAGSTRSLEKVFLLIEESKQFYEDRIKSSKWSIEYLEVLEDKIANGEYENIHIPDLPKY